MAAGTIVLDPVVALVDPRDLRARLGLPRSEARRKLESRLAAASPRPWVVDPLGRIRAGDGAGERIATVHKSLDGVLIVDVVNAVSDLLRELEVLDGIVREQAERSARFETELNWTAYRYERQIELIEARKERLRLAALAAAGRLSDVAHQP